MRDGIIPSLIYFIFFHIDATNSLKTSVSNGKSAVASAITDKGVSTSATATFSTMASNIRAISTLEIPTDENSGYITTGSSNGVEIILHKSTPRPKKYLLHYLQRIIILLQNQYIME